MNYVFGKDIRYRFYPTVEGERTLLIPTQTATAYLFSSKPSRDNAQNGTGPVVGSVINSTWAAGQVYCDFTIPAIDDPDPDGSDNEHTYWVGINFILQASEQSQTEVRGLIVRRIRSQTTELVISETDITNAYPSALNYVESSSQLNALTEVGKTWIRTKLRNRGYDWVQIHEVERFRDVVVYRILAHLFMSQIQRQGDGYQLLYNEFAKMADDLLNEMKFAYDQFDQGEPSTSNTQDGFAFLEG